MADYLSVVAGVLGALLLAILVTLVLSTVFVAYFAIVVFLKREAVPIVYSVRSLVGRRVTTAATSIGLGLVVFVFTTVLMFGSGIQYTLVSTGDTRNAKILRKGAQNEIESDVSREQMRVLAASPEVATGNDGKPLLSYELVVLIFALREHAKDDNDGANLTVRGVGPAALDLHRPADLEGRMFRSGTNEVVVGSALAGRFKGATLGGKLQFGRRTWTVVGIASHDKNAYESEVWGDLDSMENAFNRRPVTVSLRLRDERSLEKLRTQVEGDLRLNSLQVLPEPAYWRARSERFAKFVTILGVTVALIFCAGAILGAMITMHGQVAARTRDIGTLRAIGFKQRAVLVSFVAESVLLALASGLAGIAAAAAAQGLRFSTMNWQTDSEVAFQFHLTPVIIVAALGVSLLLGYAGGVLPALRAARMPILFAFRGG